MKKSLFSKTKIKIKEKDKVRAISLILENSLMYENTYIEANGDLVIVVLTLKIKPFKTIFYDSNIEAEYNSYDGILSFLNRLKKRYGIMLGLMFLLFFIFTSKNIVWKIDVEGNNTVSDIEIVEQLERVGFTLGTYIPKIDYDDLHNRFLLNSENISWISVNISGNVAYVTVKERMSTNKEDEILYSNLIAASDAQIESIIVADGKKMVKVGDIVKKGDLLISGIINSQSEGVRYERAKGEIKAYVNKTINVKIPFLNTKKQYTGNIYKEYKYKLFNFPIKIASKYGNSNRFYDTISKKETLNIFGIFHLPITVETVSYYEYVSKDIYYSTDEAVNIAFAQLKNDLDCALKDSELISKDITTSYDQDYFYIKCDLYCLENIAEEQSFYLEE